MKYSPALTSLVLASGLVGAAGPGCTTKDKDTQLTVAVLSETEVPKELDALEVVVRSANGSEVLRVPHDVEQKRFFPSTLAVIPADEESLEGPVTIEVRGGKLGPAGQVMDGTVFRRATVRYVEGRTLLVPMALRMACFSFRDCGPTQTCAGGTCVSAELDTSTLADYAPGLVFAPSGTPGCFDEAECLADSEMIEVGQDCTFPLPPGDFVNVSIRWAAAEFRIIGLDGDDPVEGWTRIDASRGRLSQGVCDSLLDPEPDPNKRRVPDQALDARVSRRCVTKRRTQPVCESSSPDVQTGIGTVIQP